MEFDIPALWQPFAAIGNISSILTRRFKKKKKKKDTSKKLFAHIVVMVQHANLKQTLHLAEAEMGT